MKTVRTLWAPDGVGLPPGAVAIVADKGHTVHLRLTAAGHPQPVAACGDAALGGWWSGSVGEVTCEGCRRSATLEPTLTEAGRHVRARFATLDTDRDPDDPVRHNPAYIPCAHEHEDDPGRVCIRPWGHR